MKYIISESQHRRLQEYYDYDEENNIMGNPSEQTLMVADFLIRYDIVDPRSILIFDDEIQIFRFEGMDFKYFGDNYVALHVSSNRGNIDIDIEFPRYEDEELEGIDQVIILKPSPKVTQFLTGISNNKIKMAKSHKSLPKLTKKKTVNKRNKMQSSNLEVLNRLSKEVKG
jgi:hypothetical protein